MPVVTAFIGDDGYSSLILAGPMYASGTTVYLSSLPICPLIKKEAEQAKANSPFSELMINACNECDGSTAYPGTTSAAPIATPRRKE